MISITRTDKEPVDAGSYQRLPIVYVGRNFSVHSTRTEMVETVYNIRVPEGARMRITGAGLKPGQGKDIQFLETVQSQSILYPGNHDGLRVTLCCARQSGAGVRIAAGDVIGYLENDLAADFKVNKKQAKKAA